MISFISLSVFAIFMTYIYFSERSKERKEAALQAKALVIFKKHLPSMNKANEIFDTYLDIDNRYFTMSNLRNWENRYRPIFDIITKEDRNSEILEGDEKDIYVLFYMNIATSGHLQQQFNEAFIEKELQQNATLFDGIEAHGLDEQQRRCVVTDEDHNLIIAGAGSGKTTTIVGKVKYAMQRFAIIAPVFTMI